MTAGRLRRVLFSVPVCCGLLVSGLAAVPTLLAAPAAAATLQAPQPPAQPPLQASPGEFVSVPISRVLDTRGGTGEPGGAAKLAAGASLTVQVTGVDGIPADATSVVANITAINTTASGYLTDYDSDNPDPNVASVGVRAGVSTNQTDTITLSSSGAVSFANHTSGSTDVVMSVTGYYTGPSDSSPGDTYGSTSWAKIVDTTTGLGTAEAPVPAGGSITVQVSGGAGGIASGAATAVVQLSALNASQTGFLTAYAAGSADPGVSLLMYASGMPYRDMAYVPLSSSGQMTITNHASAAVDVVVMTRGYFMPPATSVVGAQYVPVGPVIVRGTSSGGTALAANASVTFQVSGTAGLPATGVVEVSEHVVVTSPASSGSLAVYRGGGTEPKNPTMNFQSGDGTDVGYQDSVLSQVSPTGQETVTNESPGTLNLQVAVVGFFFVPQPPPVPSYLQTAATDTTTPVLSGIVQDATGDDPSGEIFLFSSAGAPIGGSPTAVGQVASGERVTWPVTDGTLTDGDTYQWYMEACDQGVCSAPTATQTFTVDTAAAPPPPVATANATITSASITGADAISDPGACSGSDCAISSTTTLNAGSDGTNNWASSLKLSLSSIPAGSQIVSATLHLTQSGCLTGSSCASAPIDIYQPASDVAAASTGPQLAAAAMPNPVTAIAPATQGAWDITGFVQGWAAGDPNNGLILEAAAPGDQGVAYYSPTASAGASSLPQVTIGYIPPAAPGAPTALSVTPGDGGALVSWANPSWNYVDATGNATASYTIQAKTGTTVTASATTTSDSAVLTGLTDATPYTVTVTATNPVGTGPAASSTVTPAAVPGGPSQYTQSASQFLNAQDALIAGTSTTAQKALSSDSQAASDTAQLSNEDLTDNQITADMTAHGEQDTSDTTAMTSTLAIPSAGGTVTVYATADETFTTVDTSTGTSVSIPGESVTDNLFTFTTSGGTPQLTGSVDADAAFGQVSDIEQPTAYSAVLDGPAMTAEDNNAPQPVATDSNGNFTAGTDTTSAPCISDTGGGKSGGYNCPNRTSEVKWALAHAFPGTTKDHNGFQNDCTDFSSRSLAFGGGLPQDVAPSAPLQRHDDRYWYQLHGAVTWTSRSWANSLRLGDFFNGQGSYFLKYASNAKPGYIIFASWKGQGWAQISHAGVITVVNGGNIYITQHTNNRKNESLYRQRGRISWFKSHPHLQMWIAVPSRKL